VDELVRQHGILSEPVPGEPGHLLLSNTVGNRTKTWEFSLEEVFEKIMALPPQYRSSAIQDELRLILRRIDQTPFDQSMIVPLIRNFHYLGEHDAKMIMDASRDNVDISLLKTKHPFIAMYGDLALMYYQITPLSLKLVSREQLSKAGISDDAIYPLSAKNFNRIDMLRVTEIVDGELLRASFPDYPDLNSTFFLLEDKLKRAEKVFGTDYFLIFPSAEEGIHIAKRSDPQALEKLRAVIKRAELKHNNSLSKDTFESSYIYERVNGRVQWKGLE
jgi:hypothetical protein